MVEFVSSTRGRRTEVEGPEFFLPNKKFISKQRVCLKKEMTRALTVNLPKTP
jgi:rRNA maturation protein Nop10